VARTLCSVVLRIRSSSEVERRRVFATHHGKPPTHEHG
jgi:hypothetical protein